MSNATISTSTAKDTSRTTEPGVPQRTVRRGRLSIVIVLVLGLVLSGVARQWALALQTQAYLQGPYASATGAASSAGGPNVASTIGSLDSYFLVLMLGGMRGPLVMYLWATSENQKNERDLEDFSTKVNLIRLLQPEFISVHIFQVWNLAFNISVQIPNLQDRYATILGAAEYAKAVDRARPNNADIQLMLNQVFQQKLGMTQSDNVYYRKQVRKDSFYRPADPAAPVGTFATRMQPLLEPAPSYRLQPPFVTPIQPRPADLQTRVFVPPARFDDFRKAARAAGADMASVEEQLTRAAGAKEAVVRLAEPIATRLADAWYPIDVKFVPEDWNDGSELQYLKQYEPYPYGVSTLGLGYNYGKRAQVLINRTKQKPTQLSTSVVDSRPGLELREWAKAERDRAVEAELAAFDRSGVQRGFVKWLSRAPESRDVQLMSLDYGLFSKFLADPNSVPPARPMDIRPDDPGVERYGLILGTAVIPPGPIPDLARGGRSIDEALYGFRQAARLFRDSRAEYVRHLSQPEEGIRRLQDFSSHLDELVIDRLMAEADYDFLMALLPNDVRKATGSDGKPRIAPLAGQPPLASRKEMLEQAWQNYRTAVTWNRYVNLRYYMPGEIVDRLVPSREALASLVEKPRQVDELYAYVLGQIDRNQNLDQNKSNRDENQPSEDRALQRMKQIDQMLGRTPATKPSMNPTTGPSTGPDPGA